MYRVMVVDDESYVVEWLVGLLEMQKELPVDVYPAYSAEEALSWMRRAKIDIIITDIRMKHIDGIELSATVKREWPQCKIIFLTAHAEFEYAYEAIRNNVVSYILKTEKDDRIIEEIKRAITVIDDELNHARLIEDMQIRLTESVSMIQKDTLLHALRDRFWEGGDILPNLQKAGMAQGCQPNTKFHLLLCRIENMPLNSNGIERYKQIESIKMIAEYYLGIHLNCYAAEYGIDKIVWLIHEKADTQKDAQSHADPGIFINGMLESIQKSCSETMRTGVSFVLHGDEIEAGYLPDPFYTLDTFMNSRCADRMGFIISNAGIAGSKEALPGGGMPAGQAARNNPGDMDKLVYYLEGGYSDVFLTHIDRILDNLSDCDSWYDSVALQQYYSVATVIATFVNARRLPVDIKPEVVKLFNPKSSGNWRMAVGAMKDLSERIFELQRKSDEWLSVNVIHKLKEYIDAHIAQDVSLIRLSDVTGYNPTYLSRVFSEKTNESLIDYIRRQKMKKIRQLMEDRSLSIGEIAERAGFESPTYFSRYVKNFTGMPPQKYRDSISG